MATSTVTAKTNESAAQAQMMNAIKLGLSTDEIIKRMTAGETIGEIIEDREFVLLERKEAAEAAEKAERARKLALMNTPASLPAAAPAVYRVRPTREQFLAGPDGERAYMLATITFLDAKASIGGKITCAVTKGGTPRKDKNGLPTGEVSPGGAMVIYGLGRFPITLYKSQFVRLVAAWPEVCAWYEANQGTLRDGK